MHVQLCHKTKDTEKGKIHVSKTMTVKEAMKKYKGIEAHATMAYLRYFDGWSNQAYKMLKKEAS